MDKAKIYIEEIKHQIQYAKKCFDSYKKARQNNEISLIFFYVHHFVVHVANVDKLLTPAKSTSLRAKLLSEHFDMTSINLKDFRRLRNHLEHFDERLDNWILNYEGYTFFDMNLVDGTKGFPEKAFLRAMDGDIFKFHGESYDLAQMFEELAKIEMQIPAEWTKNN